MKKKHLAILLAVITQYSATSLASQPNLDNVQAAYSTIELDDGLSDPDGFAFGASKAFSDNWYGSISYETYSTSNESSFLYNEGTPEEFLETQLQNVDLTATAIGIGYKVDMGDNSFITIEGGSYRLSLDLTNDFSIRYTDTSRSPNINDRSSESTSLSGFYIETSYQQRSEQWQYGIGVLYRDVGNSRGDIDETGLTLELMYYFTDDFAVRANYESSDTLFGIGVRYDF